MQISDRAAESCSWLLCEKKNYASTSDEKDFFAALIIDLNQDFINLNTSDRKNGFGANQNYLATFQSLFVNIIP